MQMDVKMSKISSGKKFTSKKVWSGPYSNHQFSLSFSPQPIAIATQIAKMSQSRNNVTLQQTQRFVFNVLRIVIVQLVPALNVMTKHALHQLNHNNQSQQNQESQNQLKRRLGKNQVKQDQETQDQEKQNRQSQDSNVRHYDQVSIPIRAHEPKLVFSLLG